MIIGDRRKDYGDIKSNMQDIACLWTGYLKAKYSIDFEIDTMDVPRLMRLLKMGRTLTNEKQGQSIKRDNYVDEAGYTGIEAEMLGYNKTEFKGQKEPLSLEI